MRQFGEWAVDWNDGMLLDDDDDAAKVAYLAARAAWQAAQPKWQPFETAPKDGTQFLLRVGATVLISRYSDEFLVVTGDLPKGEHKWYWAEIPGMAEEGEE